VPLKTSQIVSTKSAPPAKFLAPTPSVSEKEISRVLPRLSFRLMLVLVTLSAVVAFTVRQAFAGSSIAMALIFVVSNVAISFAFFAILFLIAWIPAVIGRDRLEDLNLGNPFSIDQLPPRVLPPRDPGT